MRVAATLSKAFSWASSPNHLKHHRVAAVRVQELTGSIEGFFFGAFPNSFGLPVLTLTPEVSFAVGLAYVPFFQTLANNAHWKNHRRPANRIRTPVVVSLPFPVFNV